MVSMCERFFQTGMRVLRENGDGDGDGEGEVKSRSKRTVRIGGVEVAPFRQDGLSHNSIPNICNDDMSLHLMLSLPLQDKLKSNCLFIYIF